MIKLLDRFLDWTMTIHPPYIRATLQASVLIPFITFLVVLISLGVEYPPFGLGMLLLWVGYAWARALFFQKGKGS